MFGKDWVRIPGMVVLAGSRIEIDRYGSATPHPLTASKSQPVVVMLILAHLPLTANSVATMARESQPIFVTGGTGYMGSRLISTLLARGHTVRALARPSSAGKLPPGCEPVMGDALQGTSYAGQIAPARTLVHLVGVSHPSPSKAPEFLRVDLGSVEAAVPAALVAGIRHFVYVSVAHPAPIMRTYVAARMRAEEIIRGSGINATLVRPWYVLGPGHRWPYALVPFYWAMRMLPPTREAATRLGLVTLKQMIAALVHAVEDPVDGVRIVDVPAIRTSPSRLGQSAAQ